MEMFSSFVKYSILVACLLFNNCVLCRRPKNIHLPDINIVIPQRVISEANEYVPALPDESYMDDTAVQTFLNTATASQVKFMLFTSLSDRGTFLDTMNSIQRSRFDPTNPTKILIHSYVPNGRPVDMWTDSFKDSLLAQENNSNIVIVDWVDASTKNFYQSVANSRYVEDQVVNLLRALKEIKNLSSEDVHIFGHGVGAHIAGYAASKVKNISRITGFDPCGRLYSTMTNEFKLDANDASFVDVIHTDDDGMGSEDPSGTVDIYFNGGSSQPGSRLNDFFVQTTQIFSGGSNIISSSHYKGIEYYKEALNNPRTWYSIYSAEDYQTFLLGTSFRFKERFGPKLSIKAHGNYFASTLESSPYLSVDDNYWTLLVRTGNTPTVGLTSIFIENMPQDGKVTNILLHPETPNSANSTGNMRLVMVYPEAKSPSEYSYKFYYGILAEEKSAGISTTLNMFEVTFYRHTDISTESLGSCTEMEICDRSFSPVVHVSESGICDPSSRQYGAGAAGLIVIVDPVALGLIAAAAGVATVPGLFLVKLLASKLKKMIGIPTLAVAKPVVKVKSTKFKLKVVKVLKAAMGVMKILKVIKVKQLKKVKILLKTIKYIPLKVGLIKILAKPISVGLKVAKLKDFLKDITGLDKDNKNIVKKLLSILEIPDNDSIFEKVVKGVIGALKL